VQNVERDAGIGQESAFCKGLASWGNSFCTHRRNHLQFNGQV